eukprot:5691102-Amphidinium_carterae.1
MRKGRKKAKLNGKVKKSGEKVEFHHFMPKLVQLRKKRLNCFFAVSGHSPPEFLEAPRRLLEGPPNSSK